MLELEQAIVGWSADTEGENGADAGRAVLRRLVLRLGDAAVPGTRRVAPLVEPLLGLRTLARDRADREQADDLRDRLAAAGIGVRDTPRRDGLAARGTVTRSR